VDKLIVQLQRLADMNGKTVTVDEAYEHLAGLVAYIKEDATGIDPSTVQRLIALAQRPDMSPVDEHLRQLDEVRNNRFQ